MWGIISSLISVSLITQIFALLNPMASFPFLLTASKLKANVRMIAVKSVISAFIIAVIIALIGPWLFKIFGISIDSFKVAGGIILLILGIDMVTPKEGEYEVKGVHSLTAIIATPLLTGPATISLITIKTYELGILPVLISLCFAFLLVGFVFILFSKAVGKINPKIVDIVSRVMGLFLTAVSIEMIAKGIEGIIRVAI